ncbi:fatty acid/sphingolipid desaturase [Russula vinacea]|nr:fatty acid/sphingolipid desaturase [Russula vinacea]
MTATTRESIATRILNGEHLFILNGHLIRVPHQWLSAHPGGALTILHFVGRDATDEVEAYHPKHVLEKMRAFSQGPVELSGDGWVPLLPPICTGWIRKLSPDERPIFASSPCQKLNAPLASGPSLASIQPPPTTLSLKTQSQHSAAYKLLHKRRHLFFPSAVCLGVLWHQVVFICHDLGHVGVTHNWYRDRLIAIFLADFVGGVSIGWWVDNHNVHHVVTNHPSHDPDIQHLPFFAITPAFFKSLYSSYYKRELTFDRFSRAVITAQHRLLYVIMSWAWWLEVFALVGFLFWYGRVLRGCGSWQTGLMYLLVSNMVPSPLHVQIVLSHYSRSTTDFGPIESFPHRQLRTTTDVICHPYAEFLHGGLHLQVTHHLFPRLPRHNLKEASYLVKEFAREQGLEYAEFGFFEGNGEVLDTLKGVANQLRIIKMVADSEIHEAMNAKTN